ncbi:MAG: squalene/phytoene synthase family protein [Candidatus Eremiobacteraeota bacterium]|nr:squalene/phytoene synthase family protein [Candidatus Eremiobacteraeota bacterium]
MDLSLKAADAYCRMLTRRHYENFSVASRFVNSARRRDLMRIYAFCRTTDDLGDESPEGTALVRLDRWRAEVEAFVKGIVPPVHPVLVALKPTFEAHAMAAQPFLDLIAANVQDQYVTHYRTWKELEGYCNLSAAPVGRMVLEVFDVHDERAQRLSDDVCVGLQLANHAQDVSRDVALGRRYLVESDVSASGTPGATKQMVGRARELLRSGRELQQLVPRPLRLQVSLYCRGGLAICDAIEGLGYNTEQRRPHVAGRTKVSLMLRAAIETFSGDQPRR